MRVAFLYLAQVHQIPHTLPIAAAMARTGRAEVTLLAAGDAQLGFVAEHRRFFPDAPMVVERLAQFPGVRWLSRKRGMTAEPKVPALLRNLRRLRGFDALVVPERTSLLLKRLGLGHTRLVWTGHGGGDRAHGYTGNVSRFDFVLLPGEKLARRHRRAGNLRDGDFGIGGYAKFDLVRAIDAAGRPTLFSNDRPTVVYNPHFRPDLSSWPRVGMAVLDFFAASRDYNLVFAPHVRLFDPPVPARYEPFRRFMALPHMRIDLGSPASVDMTYTGGADIYLGDVSSQIAEWTLKPRPMAFLNPRGIAWEGDPNWRAFELGPVARGATDLQQALRRAVCDHAAVFRPRQEAYFRDTFDVEPDEPSAPRGAAAILDYLERERAA